jgi:hypothetical protein
MSPLIRTVGGGSDEEEPDLHIAFDEAVSMQNAEVLKAALPELQKELGKLRAVKQVRLTYRFPSPPPNVAALMIGTIEGLAIVFVTGAVIAGGKQFGKDVGKEMASIANQWLRRCLAPKRKKTTRKKHSK